MNRIKKETERNAKVLWFKCHFDITTGDIYSAGPGWMDWILTFTLFFNYLYRKFMFWVFLKIVTIDYEVRPDEGETLMEMGYKMSDLIERGNK